MRPIQQTTKSKTAAAAAAAMVAFAVGMPTGPLGAEGAWAIGAPIQIANTGGQGVNMRSGPGTGHGKVGWIPEGASPDYNCYVWGERIGGVPIWFNVNWGGATGFYASYYDNSSYRSDAELQSKYGVPMCGAAAPAPPATAPAAPVPPGAPAPEPQPSPASPGSSAPPAGGPKQLEGGASLYFSPYRSRDKGKIRDDNEKWVYAPSPANALLERDQWYRVWTRKGAKEIDDGCPDPMYSVPGGDGTAGGRRITTLAAWSLARNSPALFLKQNPAWAGQINYILLFDPGSKAEYAGSPCNRHNISKIFADWLGTEGRTLVIISGRATADVGKKSKEGRGHAGIQDTLFPEIKKAGKTVRQRVVVCNNDTVSHPNIWIKYRDYMNRPPITTGTCPDGALGWHP